MDTKEIVSDVLQYEGNANTNIEVEQKDNRDASLLDKIFKTVQIFFL